MKTSRKPEKKSTVDSRNIVPITEDQFKQSIGADRIEAVHSDVMKKQLSDLLQGNIPPPNEFIGYLVDQLKAGNNEFLVVQQNIQELNLRLGKLQKRIIQLQGEQNKYVKDIFCWLEKLPNTKTHGFKKEDSDERR